jgi:hypothetical protein
MKKTFHTVDDHGRDRLTAGDHLSDEDLIRSLDGELSSRQSGKIDAHLLSCWSCRGRKHVIEEGIRDLVDYQNAVAAPYLPPSMEQRAIFIARLNSMASEIERPWQWNRVLGPVLQFFKLHPVNQVAQIAAILLLAASGMVAYLVRSSSVVSADELLNRSTASYAKTLETTPEPIIVQKLHVQIGREALTRTIYRDIAHNRATSRTEANGTGEERAKAAYAKSSLDWNSPLEPQVYRHWLEGHSRSRERVVQSGVNQLTLQTEFSSGPVAEANLTVRTTDYHAIEESIRFEDQSEIEIAEVSYDVIPFASLPEEVFGFPLAPVLARIPAQPALRVLTPTNAELVSAEVQAESALHALGGDLGEQIDISIQPGQGVLIDGVVSDDARRQRLLAALGDILHTRVRLLTVDEAVQQSEATSSAGGSRTATPSVQVMVATPPLLDAQLNSRFPDKDQRIAYVNQALSLAQLASARAWALNRLADRHPSPDIALLDETTRRDLQALLIDHVSVLREDLSSLQNQLAEILSRSSNTPAANTATPIDAGDGAESQKDWRGRIRRVHSSTEAIHEAVVTLLTTSPSGSQNDVEAIEINLRTSLTQLQTELQDLDQEVRKANLR